MALDSLDLTKCTQAFPAPAVCKSLLHAKEATVKARRAHRLARATWPQEVVQACYTATVQHCSNTRLLFFYSIRSILLTYFFILLL